MHDVDISKNYGNGTIPVRGRESHTADLGEFDRYIDMLREMNREKEEELWKVGILTGMNLEESEEEDGSCEGEREGVVSKPPQSIDVDSFDLSFNFEGSADFSASDH